MKTLEIRRKFERSLPTKLTLLQAAKRFILPNFVPD